jgi:hypothetical protein
MKPLATLVVLIVITSATSLSFATSTSVEGKSRLPKTQEEYRLTLLWMNARDEGDFTKADELKRRVKEERLKRFKDETPEGRIQMVSEAREEARTATVRIMKQLDSHIAVASPAVRPNLRKFKETLRKSSEEEDEKFAMLLAEMVVEQETLAREALRDAELEALKAEKDEAQLEKKAGELVEKWRAEDESRRASLEKRLEHLVAAEAQSEERKAGKGDSTSPPK